MANQESTSIFRLRATGVVYEPGMMAPKILIHARGFRAQRMIEIAQQKGVPVVVNPDLSYALSLVPEDFEIPEELYQVMANLLIHLGKAGLDQ
jgi:flagellar biosynthesis protein